MKRKGRKSKPSENSSNGVGDRQEENGDTSDHEEPTIEEPEDKKRKSNKRKSSTKKPEEETKEDEPQYEVEQVLDEKLIRGVRHYLIRWKGYEPESDTWEPESTLNCAELITDFKNKQKKNKPKGKPAKKTDNEKGGDDEPSWDENEDFEVERILDVYFKKNGKREFLVSWKGYPNSQNSWEPEDNMDCKDLIKKFMSKVDKAKEAEPRELRLNRPHTDRLTLLSDGHLGRRLSKRNVGKQRVHYHDAE